MPNTWKREFEACTLTFLGIDEGDIQVSGDQTTIDLVKAAHGTASTGPEVLALKKHLGAASQEWEDYVKARDDNVWHARNDAIVQRGLEAHFRMQAINDMPSNRWNELYGPIQDEFPDDWT